jgi:hypothetical protein
MKALTTPTNPDIDLQTDPFPILVKLDWKLSDKLSCPDKRIIIQRIKKISD